MSGKPKKTYGKKVTAHVSGWFARDLWNAAVPAAPPASSSAAAAAAGRSGSGSGSGGGGNGTSGGSGGNSRAVLDLDSDDEEDCRRAGGRGKDADKEDEEAKDSQSSSRAGGGKNANSNGKAITPALRSRTNTTAAAASPSESESESDTESDTYSANGNGNGISVTVTSPHSPHSHRRPKPSLAHSSPSSSEDEDDDDDDDGLDIPGTPEHEELEANILALLTPTASTTPSAPETSDKENDLPAYSSSYTPASSSSSSPSSSSPHHHHHHHHHPHPPLARRTRTPTGVPGSPREALKERAITPIESPARKNGVRKKRASVVSPLVRARPGSGVGAGADIKVWEDGKERGGGGGREEEREMMEKMRRVTIGLEEVLDLGRKAGVGEVEAEVGVKVKEVQAGYQGYAGSDTSELTELDAEEEEEEEEEGEAEYEEDECEYYVDDTALEELLGLCTAPTVLDFTEHITALQSTHTITKLGEASYSEVFLSTPLTPAPTAAPTVLKIIPFAAADQCTLTAILQEVSITRTMAAHRGFIGFRGAHVCRGVFPDALMRCWDDFEERRGSENERPEFYGAGQWWAVIALEMGGVDLEHFVLRGWREALHVFWQVAEALAAGEEQEFEHRDLHYGNIVIQRRPTSGLKVSLIDYTLSRALCAPTTPASKPRAHFAALDDPALFSGKGDYQFDIYRFMRTHLSSGLAPPPPGDGEEGEEGEGYINWDVYAPRTNVFWLHYLACVLLRRKGLPRGRRIAADGGGGGGAEREAFAAVERIVAGIDPRKKRFGGAAEVGSAREVLEWARGEGLWEEGGCS